MAQNVGPNSETFILSDTLITALYMPDNYSHRDRRISPSISTLLLELSKSDSEIPPGTDDQGSAWCAPSCTVSAARVLWKAHIILTYTQLGILMKLRIFYYFLTISHKAQNLH